jgi:hypothetical protein
VFVLIGKIVTGTIPSLTERGVPARVAALVASAMHRDPAARPTAATLARDLAAAREALTDDEMDRVYGRSAPEPGAIEEDRASHLSPLAESTAETRSMVLKGAS